MFSIIIPLYNKSKYVLRAIESVFQQKITDWEIIVVDDGSTDDGYTKVFDLQSDKITIIQQKNSGVSVSRNLGISKSQYPYIAFLDADDYWHSEYLSTLQKGIFEFPNIGIWCSGYSRDINDLGLKSGEFEVVKNYFQKAIWNGLFFTSSVVINKLFFLNQPGFKAYLKKGEDLDIWYRSFCFFGSLVYCPDKLVLYEKGDLEAATKTPCHINASILSDILKEDYLSPQLISSCQKASFDTFKVRLVYYNILLFFKHAESHATISLILSQIENKYRAIDIFYKLPYSFLSWFFSNGIRKRYFQKYITFCFNHIYKY